MLAKMGRPTTNPRPFDVHVRVNAADLKTLNDYCESEGVNRTEAISRAINRLKDSKKE